MGCRGCTTRGAGGAPEEKPVTKENQKNREAFQGEKHMNTMTIIDQEDRNG
jgi:hypothetical protein